MSFSLSLFVSLCRSVSVSVFVSLSFSQVQIRVGAGVDEGGLDFHFDKDEALLRESDCWCHPHASTVTYLHPAAASTGGRGGGGGETSSASKKSGGQKEAGHATSSNSPSPRWGAPLVVFNTTSHESAATAQLRPRGAQPSRAWVLFPRPGNHVKFTGNLLHGVPSELNAHLYGGAESESESGGCGRSYERIALPVNIWTQHQPQAVQRISQQSIDAMQQSQTLTKSQLQTKSRADSDTYFRIDCLQPAPLSALSAPSLSSGDDLASLDRNTLPPDFDAGGVHFLQEHVEGSTGHLPRGEVAAALARCREEARRSGGSSGSGGGSSSSDSSDSSSGSSGDGSDSSGGVDRECGSVAYAGLKISYF
jgi:hypothetical protein